MPPTVPIRHDPLRYVEHVDAGYSSPCWIWQRQLAANGYARCRGEDGVPVYVHRLVYEAQVGPIPAGLHIDHLCANRACVNPDHLEVVTQTENNRRASAKITIEDAEAIRASTLSGRAIARQYGIHNSVVSRIRTGERWKPCDSAS